MQNLEPEDEGENLREFKANNYLYGPLAALDYFDPIQLGFIHESLIRNANDCGLNSPRSKGYLVLAERVKAAIDGNCGWDEYLKCYQAQCRAMADYDGRMGWRDNG